jgi:acyl carrier protein
MLIKSILFEEFSKGFAEQFENVNSSSLSAKTIFRELPEWSSMQSLIVISSFDWNYGVILRADELRSCITLGDLYEKVLFKKNQ